MEKTVSSSSQQIVNKIEMIEIQKPRDVKVSVRNDLAKSLSEKCMTKGVLGVNDVKR